MGVNRSRGTISQAGRNDSLTPQQVAANLTSKEMVSNLKISAGRGRASEQHLAQTGIGRKHAAGQFRLLHERDFLA
jgi:hypothetical protein